jgi:hypothetical protein
VQELTECIYCGRDVIHLDPADIDDEEGWAIRAPEHEPDCEWILTRAHHIADD